MVDWPDLTGTRYSIVERLARGGMGTVFVAEDHELRRRVALKVLGLAGEEARARMLREARILARLDHPGIVPVHDVLRLPDGRLAYAMKLVRGERLDAHLTRLEGLRERLRVFERICEAVAFAHSAGVIHRDLKPGNVMVGPFGEVLVMDWGVAKLRAEAESPDATREDPAQQAAAAAPALAIDARDTLSAPVGLSGDGDTRPGTVLGTPGYMSPEQRAGRIDRVDQRTDVYALGVMLREIAEGAGERTPRRLQAIVAKATAHAPEARYPGVVGLATDVSRFLDGGPVSAYQETPYEVMERFLQRHRGPILLILTYLVVRTVMLLTAGT